DLLTIGAGTVVRKESFFQGYRARSGRIEIGAVTIGRDAVVGERTVLDIDTSVGDEAQLGHASTLHSGQAVPAGERWHGSPGQRTPIDYRRAAPLPSSTVRRVSFSIGTLLMVFLVYLPLAEASLFLLATQIPSLGNLVHDSIAGTSLRAMLPRLVAGALA